MISGGTVQIAGRSDKKIPLMNFMEFHARRSGGVIDSLGGDGRGVRTGGGE